MAINPSQIREIKNTKEWARQIIYWRTHLDVFIEHYFKVKLKDCQKVQARAFGNCDDLYFVQSRGAGKTWLTAVCCLAIAVLYPGSQIAVVSGTAEQAVLVMRKIDQYFSKIEDIAREIETNGRRAVSPLTNHKGRCRLKNGSIIESFSLGTFRGNRAKVVVIDEAPEVKKTDLQEIVKPVRNYTRDHCIQLGIKDYPSKMVSITSACLKSNYFYEEFVNTLKKMANGDTRCFASSLSYEAAARMGITAMEYFEKEKKDMPEASFAIEYGSMFLGAERGSVFPYELTDKCRTLTEVEVAQPARSTADYIMSIDLATSNSQQADNSVITILKLVDCEDGSYIKKLVYIRSFHGKRLDAIAVEVRKLLVKFPNISRVIFDYRGLGDAFPQFMSQPWTDPETNKEYPPLVVDDENSQIRNAIHILHPVIATNVINQQMVSALTVALERELVQIPVNSRRIVDGKVATDDEDEEEDQQAPKKAKLTPQEKAIFIEADALQVEMGNVVARESGSGNILYDVAKSNQHKDRYSSLAMAVYYVWGLEQDRRAKYYYGGTQDCVGVFTTF